MEKKSATKIQKVSKVVTARGRKKIEKTEEQHVVEETAVAALPKVTSTGRGKKATFNGTEPQENGHEAVIVVAEALPATKVSKGRGRKAVTPVVDKLSNGDELTKSTESLRGRKTTKAAENEVVAKIIEKPTTKRIGRIKKSAEPVDKELKKVEAITKRNDRTENAADAKLEKAVNKRGSKIKSSVPKNEEPQVEEKVVEKAVNKRGSKIKSSVPQNKEPQSVEKLLDKAVLKRAGRSKSSVPKDEEPQVEEKVEEKAVSKRVVRTKKTVEPKGVEQVKETKAASGKRSKEIEEEVPKKRARIDRKAAAAIVKEEEAEEYDETAVAVATKKTKPSEKENAEKKSRKRGATKDDKDDEAVDVKATKILKNSIETVFDKDSFNLQKQYNLKICSWNIAGLRAWIKKDGFKILEYEEPDIFCVQETKCDEEQLPKEAERLPGYHRYWLCKPGGYAGVALYSRIMPINIEYGIGNEEFDEHGRIITAEYEKFYLINIYVPNSGKKLVNLEPRMRWEEIFLDYIKRLDKLKPLIICGDMNVSHQEIDLANPKSNTRSAGFTKEERDKMTQLLAAGFVDTYRHLYPKKTGAYTFWTYMKNARDRNIGWRLDYFLVSKRILSRVVDQVLRSQVKGSDHCPLTLFLNI